MTVEEEGRFLPFMEHAVELRRRLLRSLVWVGAGFAASFPFSERMVAFLGKLAGTPLVFTTPTEAFWITIKTAFYGGLLLSFPGVLYEAWAFVSPGLYRDERRSILLWVGGGSLFFLLGVAFSFFVALPTALSFLVHFGEGEGLRAFMSVDRTISFEWRFLLVFGLIFELPVIMGFLSDRGLVAPDTFRRSRRWAVVGNAVLASILSPTQDFLNMMIMFVPLLILYESGILAASWAASRRQKRLSEGETAAS
ncbi:MAG: twin-arginine translocase subunit TatC [Nitrospirae bacterium]|nr:MAG: Sec-independent protein translocase, TatC subunit [Leptospirillum sp. Group IV 'UBA BS']MCL4484930.1 twin-arginine translocase subunit TatC [Nitrospirota bacterium]MCL5284707.1 twin-arginine translocase subunit TatC [Nitrospirota bacterium]